MSQGHKWRRGVKVVVTDGSRTYKASVDACLPHARHVLDRFHVIRGSVRGRGAPRHPAPRAPALPGVFRGFRCVRVHDTRRLCKAARSVRCRGAAYEQGSLVWLRLRSVRWALDNSGGARRAMVRGSSRVRGKLTRRVVRRRLVADLVGLRRRGGPELGVCAGDADEHGAHDRRLRPRPCRQRCCPTVKLGLWAPRIGAREAPAPPSWSPRAPPQPPVPACFWLDETVDDAGAPGLGPEPAPAQVLVGSAATCPPVIVNGEVDTGHPHPPRPR